MPADVRQLTARKDAPRRARLSALALISPLAGLLSLYPLAYPAGGLVAVVTGWWARVSIRRSAGSLRGMTPALLGVALGCVGLGTTAVSIWRMVAVYREVTPLAKQVFASAAESQWDGTYELFAPAYRAQVALAAHAESVRRMFVGRGAFQGFRWSHPLSPGAGWPGLGSASVVYDAEFTNGEQRFVFKFVHTGSGWYIEEIRAQ